MNFIDRTGQKCRALTTTSTWERRGKRIFWLCKCECGGERWIPSSRYFKQRTTDCGCGIGKRDRKSKYIGIIKDGTNSKIYNVWSGIIRRCTNPNYKRYHKYGGRGIKVCDEWLNSFEAFYNDMGDLPFEGATIDRIDNDDGYYKENCRWVTMQQNAWNQGAQEGSSSKYKGVSKVNSMNKGTRWHSSIKRTLDGEHIQKSKTFDTETEAAEWYNEQAKELFGEYAYLNKINYEE